MKYFVGIDLGTTNSAISVFDGKNVCVWKKDQRDVMPSAIYVDKRGKRFYGVKAYENSFLQPDRCAKLFKRFMGTSTKFKLGDDELTPEECSVEILRELYKILPEGIRKNKDEIGTVITVPAAFNQMQNAATLDAAKMAGLGKVALMQEPVAAIMRVMKDNQADGKFLVFDLGGGTLDVAIAERTSGKVNFLANGGLTMCGGRDFDRIIVNEFIVPWLEDNYSLPDGWREHKKYKTFLSVATYMAEQAKIELSSNDSVKVYGDMRMEVEDDDGEEIYLDVDISREDYDAAIAELVMKAIETARATIDKAGLTASDIDKIIFIGGPTNYKPLCDRVIEELGISSELDVNPMTAVSEGAAMFAEAVDWTSEEHERKATREQFKSDAELGLSFRYESRTPDKKARIAVMLERAIDGYTFEITSLDTGWNSGVIQLRDKAIVSVPLYKRGENKFSVEVYDRGGDSVFLENDTIVITQTYANVGALLAAHSISVEVKERIGSSVSRLAYLIREGDTLPAKGQTKFRAGKRLRAGDNDSLNFKLWQGAIEDKVDDNQLIGALKISGDDFEFGTIVEGAELICDYTIDEAGSIKLEVDIPAINESFYGNFYEREDAQLNFGETPSKNSAVDKINIEGKDLLDQVRELGRAIDDDDDYEKLQHAGEVASTAISANHSDNDKEALLHIEQDLQAAKKTLAAIRERNRENIRREELDYLRRRYENYVKNFAEPQEITQYENLLNRAESLIEREDSSFDDVTSEIYGWNWMILFYRDDEYVVRCFNGLVKNPGDFDDKTRFYQLAGLGRKAIAQKDYASLRKIVNGLYSIGGRKGDELLTANIIKA